MSVGVFFLALCASAAAWPDGAPCVHAAFESMNPLEAVEHEGGLQLDLPPYRIQVDQRCYWRNQPVTLTLLSDNKTERFRGFVIQPFIYYGPNQLGPRIGEFMRLDDNGAWQQQCFRFKDSVTHANDERKSQVRLWWRNDAGERDIIQFVATVVHSLKKFWVRSVFSPPIPPCASRMPDMTASWQPPMPTYPPPVKPFKLETRQLFGNFGARAIGGKPIDKDMQGRDGAFIRVTNTPTLPTGSQVVTVQEITPAPPMTTPRPQPVFRPRVTSLRPQTTPSAATRQMTQIIPLNNMELIHSHSFNMRVSTIAGQTGQTLGPTFARPTVPFQVVTPPPSPAPFQPQMQFRQVQRPVFFNSACADVDAPQRCFAWFPYCSQSAYMATYCRRTCRFC